MLHKKKLDPKVFGVLEQLMTDPVFTDHFLVGGTALTLQGNPRMSMDIDMFTRKEMDIDSIHDHLVKNYGFVERFRSKNTIKGDIDGIDTDMITFNYPLLAPLETDGNIRSVSLLDLATMKLNAIARSGDRIKDFFDVAFLSTKFSLNTMLDAYERKFNTNSAPALIGLTYYGDLDMSDTVRTTNGKFKWPVVEKRLKEMILEPDKIFKSFDMENEKRQERTHSR